TTWVAGFGAVFFTLLVALVTRNLVHRAITRIVDQIVVSGARERPGETRGRALLDGSLLLARERRQQRAETMGSILRSLASATILAITALTLLSEFDLENRVRPLLFSASVLGVTIAFGAQSLVKDFLSGMFMIIEDQYGVGDVVDVGDTKGTVEEVGLRTTRI